VVTEAIAIRESSPPVIVPRTLDEMINIAERISKSNLLPEELRGKVPEVLMQIMAGQELGLYSMASLRSFHIIKGKPVMGADAMVAVILGSGKAEYFKRVGEGSDKSVTYATKRRGHEEQRCTWTWEMAKAAALTGKDNWRTFPRQMLASRAKAELARDVFPDVLAGCYTIDEIRDGEPSLIRDEHREEVQDAEFADVPSAPAPAVDLSQYPEIAACAIAPDEQELKALAKQFAARKLGPGPAYEAMSAAYKARVQWFKAEAAKAVPTKPPASAASSSAGDATQPSSDGSSNASTGEG
jgi:hypothetical protein